MYCPSSLKLPLSQAVSAAARLATGNHITSIKTWCTGGASGARQKEIGKLMSISYRKEKTLWKENEVRVLKKQKLYNNRKKYARKFFAS